MEDIIESLKKVSVVQEPYKNDEKCASVLVLLCEVAGTCHVLLNKRSENLRRHPGQVCFPGGMRDSADTDVVDTALRECEEEIGLGRDNITVTCVLPTLKVYQKTLHLTPVIGTVAPDLFNTFQFTKNTAEVADIFHVPLSLFLQESPTPPLISHIVEPKEGFDTHHFNVTHENKAFDVMGITAHLNICVAILGLQRNPEYSYRLPSAYLIVADPFKQYIMQIVGTPTD